MNNLVWTHKAWQDYLYWQTQDKKTLKKINELVKDIERNGVLKGTGKPEVLKNESAYSRRIDEKNRLVYRIVDGFIKQCKNTRDSSTRRVLVMRHVLVKYELHEDFSKHIGKLVCRHGAKPCNKETELLGTLKASMTTTQ